MAFRLSDLRAALGSDERGSIAPMFGLLFLVLMMFSGIAIDYARVQHSQTKILAAADAAALAGGRALLDGRLSDEDVRTLTLKYFNENVSQSGKFGDIKNVAITIDRSKGSVTLDIDAEVPMTITRVEGFQKTAFPVYSEVVSDQHDIELGMALDITGSMSGRKIADLKAAAKDLVDILLPDAGTTNKVRIGLAPYAASVNAGSFASTVTGGASTNGCVHERGTSDAFTDVTPAAGNFLGFRTGMSCPSAKVVPMTSDKASLKSSINGYSAGGTTAGHLGAAWAWYLVSPEWSSIWPASGEPVAYGDGKTIKAIVLMTDGIFNTQYIPGNGNSSDQARGVCDEAKAKDVIVFSVAFESPGAAEHLLRQCASTADHFFSASNGDELRQAFIEIAHQLNNLRLTQ